MKHFSLIVLALTLFGNSAHAAPSSGTMKCFGASSRSEPNNYRIISASLRPYDGGYSLLIVTNAAPSVLVLDRKSIVVSAATLEGDKLIPWNLHHYDQKPMKLGKNGSFSLEGMAVSTRSYCSFNGTAVYLEPPVTNNR